ncbi:MAG: hypothetical protein QXS37_01490 [Candidatus Aenigmatarchaeota archaeon]
MKIEIKDFKIKNNDEWDIQRAYLILQLDSIDIILPQDKRKEYIRKVTEFLWGNIKKQFPKIERFLTGKKGGFNRVREMNYNTPIIYKCGDFYMELIGHNSKKIGLICEEIKLEPYRFFFDLEEYFNEQVVNAINKLIINGYNKKEDFTKLVNALNETALTKIVTKGKFFIMRK